MQICFYYYFLGYQISSQHKGSDKKWFKRQRLTPLFFNISVIRSPGLVCSDLTITSTFQLQGREKDKGRDARFPGGHALKAEFILCPHTFGQTLHSHAYLQSRLGNVFSTLNPHPIKIQGFYYYVWTTIFRSPLTPI